MEMGEESTWVNFKEVLKGPYQDHRDKNLLRKQNLRTDIDLTTIRRESDGSMSNWCESRVLCLVSLE